MDYLSNVDGEFTDQANVMYSPIGLFDRSVSKDPKVLNVVG